MSTHFLVNVFKHRTSQHTDPEPTSNLLQKTLKRFLFNLYDVTNWRQKSSFESCKGLEFSFRVLTVGSILRKATLDMKGHTVRTISYGLAKQPTLGPKLSLVLLLLKSCPWCSILIWMVHLKQNSFN